MKKWFQPYERTLVVSLSLVTAVLLLWVVTCRCDSQSDCVPHDDGIWIVGESPKLLDARVIRYDGYDDMFGYRYIVDLEEVGETMAFSAKPREPGDEILVASGSLVPYAIVDGHIPEDTDARDTPRP